MFNSSAGSEPPLYLIDWQMFGKGHCAVELCYFFSSCVNPNQDVDMKLLKLYHNSLSEALGSECNYTFEQLWHDFAIVNLDFAAAIMARRYKVDRPDGVAKREKANEGFRKKRHALDSLDVRLLERCLWIFQNHYDEFFS